MKKQEETRPSKSRKTRKVEVKKGKRANSPKLDAKSPGTTTTTSTMTLCSWLLWTAKRVGSVLLVVYVGIPVLIWLNPWIHPKVIFLNMVRWPPVLDLSHPAQFGLNATRNMYMQHGDVNLGIWHSLPQSLVAEIEQSDNGADTFETLLSSGKPIILYLHGNTGTRAGWHRVQLYKLLTQLDFHVITLDYRGYGDSTGSPSENGVCADATYLYNWIKERKGSSPIFIWGHSLGTGITTKVAKALCKKNDLPVGVILESPFNNIREAASNHPLTVPYRFLPGFSWIFLDSIKENDIYFASDENIVDVTTPLLILHAHDDGVVPFALGEKLYKAAQKSRTKESHTVKFVEFNSTYGYGHKHIFKAPELPEIIGKFVEHSLKIHGGQ